MKRTHLCLSLSDLKTWKQIMLVILFTLVYINISLLANFLINEMCQEYVRSSWYFCSNNLEMANIRKGDWSNDIEHLPNSIHVATVFLRIKFDSTYRAFGYHCSLRQYDIISRWRWRLTGILLAFPLVSKAIWRLHHTDEGCSDGRKLCKCCQTLSWGIQLQHV